VIRFKDISILYTNKMELSSKYNKTSTNIRTHTYWLTPKEYRKMTKHPIEYAIVNSDNTVTRTHIYFE
jgi:hypothetical protein|tara:strand:- start:1458 stop:1661 length:204 start_codon:yes stop_codon:yes gene_type:complete